MTPEEITKLCRYIKAACPNQVFDEYTPEVWAEILPASYTLAECRAAVAAVKQRQPYVDVSDVIAEVKRARRAEAARESLRTALDPTAYRAHLEAADARTLALIQARAGRTLAIDGPPPLPRDYAGVLSGRVITGPQALALHQAAESRAAREAREAES